MVMVMNEICNHISLFICLCPVFRWRIRCYFIRHNNITWQRFEEFVGVHLMWVERTLYLYSDIVMLLFIRNFVISFFTRYFHKFNIFVFNIQNYKQQKNISFTFLRLQYLYGEEYRLHFTRNRNKSYVYNNIWNSVCCFRCYSFYI